MTNNRKKDRPIPIKSWLILIAVFIIVQLLFIAIDGTEFEPNINDSGNITGRILDSTLFTEWFTPYDFPFFNMATAIFAIAILGKTGTDIFSSIFHMR